jgi:Flp pilus assembly protein TadD
MNRVFSGLVLAALATGLFYVRGRAQDANAEQIARYRNLGKAFYENPTTQAQAVDQFRKVLELAPNSAHERVNYGLALLRAGKTEEGIAELQKAQKQDPRIPNTWFNLGIVFKKDSQYEPAVEQFEGMVKLVPDEPVSHYNLGVLYKLTGKADAALTEFETSERLNPNLAGPHFQLYNAYRASGRAEDSAREDKTFQEIKKRQASAAVPEDLEWSYYAEIADPPEQAADQNIPPPGPIKFQEKKLGSGFDQGPAGLVFAAVDDDVRPDLIVWSANKVRVFLNGGTEEVELGLGGLRDVISIAPGDFNNDGRTDLAVITKNGVELYVNKNGKFEKLAATLPQGPFVKAVWVDYDHDYDLDLVLLGPKCALLRNNGTSGFSDETASFPFVSGNATDGVLFDAVRDTDGRDLAVVYADRPGVLYRDRLNGRYEAQELAAAPAGSGTVTAYDVNNDGWTDLVVSNATAITPILNHGGVLDRIADVPGHGPSLFADLENRGAADLVGAGVVLRNGGVNPFTSSNMPETAQAVALAKADVDADGRVDLAVLRKDGAVVLLVNQTPGSSSWIRTKLLGVKNLKLAYGAKVEIKAGTLYQKQMYTGMPLDFGMGLHKDAETVRITWPNGLIQNQVNQKAGQAAEYKEAPRLSGSCPMIFTWDGKNFQFISDVLGVAPLGASSGDGTYFPVDHTEYVQIPGDALQAVDGKYEVRITEELREVSYLDQVQLIAVDHPRGIEIFTNDKFKAPPFPDSKLFGVERRVYAQTAVDQDGNDVLRRIAKRDQRYVDNFSRDYAGRAAMHTLDLDFGKAAPEGRAILVLNGWVDWADGSTFLAAAQGNKEPLTMPYLQVKDASGNWQTVVADMGIPSGKPKSIVVDLRGKFLSASREVRIVTNLCVYWDEIFLSEDVLSEGPAAGGVTTTPLAPLRADLHFRGFSRTVIQPERKQPEQFLYDQVSMEAPWNPTLGFYTRYGEVGELLAAADDRMVLMGSGDETRMLFDATRLPPLKNGWKRDFMLRVEGWAKDADANTAFGRTVEPLPFHAMSAYPYSAGEKFPDDWYHQKYLREYNTRPALSLVPPLTSLRRIQLGTE